MTLSIARRNRSRRLRVAVITDMRLSAIRTPGGY
jgi:hypothetical protein